MTDWITKKEKPNWITRKSVGSGQKQPTWIKKKEKPEPWITKKEKSEPWITKKEKPKAWITKKKQDKAMQKFQLGRARHNIGGRANLLEEMGRLDAERMNPNRRAEKHRVIGELNKGYKSGGAVLKGKKVGCQIK